MSTVLPKRVFPTSVQGLLVRALLASDEEFVEKWNQWKGVSGEYRDLDYGSLRLFPLAYRKLVRLFPEDSLLTVCKNAYQTSWLKNSLLLSEAVQTMDLLAEKDMPFLVLKGAAFSSLYYDNDVAIRELDDVDLLIPVDYFPQSITAILAQHPEYRTHTHLQFFQPQFFHEISLYTDKGILDMHCHLLHNYLHNDDWALFRDSAQEVNFRGRAVMTLSDSDHLLHVCAHAYSWSGQEGAQLRWIIDAIRIIETGRVDWKEVIRKARTLCVTLPLVEAFTYLGDNFSVNIPNDVCRELGSDSVSVMDRRMFLLESQDTHTYVLPALELYWWRYVKALHRPYTFGDSIQKLRLFLTFLCQTSSLYEIPGIVGMRFSQLVGRFLKRMLAIDFLL